MSNSKPEGTNLMNTFTNSLQQLQGNFHILEQRVPVERQIAYFKFSDKLKREHTSSLPFGDERVESIYATLCDDEPSEANPISKAEKRRLLSLLAISRSVKAFRLLQSYIQNPDPEIEDWAAMALMEARLALESELSDEKQIYIATALGGKGQKLRFSIVLYAKGSIPFLPYQRQAIEKEVAFWLPKLECEVERLEVKALYARLLCLIPVRADVPTIMQKVVNGCNECGNFLEQGFTISNVNELTEEEILREIENKRNESNKASD